MISPDEMNHRIAIVTVAPMTTGGKRYPTRVQSRPDDKDARIVPDQIRMVDKLRLARKAELYAQAGGW